MLCDLSLGTANPNNFISTPHPFCTEARKTLYLMMYITTKFTEQNLAHKNNAIIFLLFIVMEQEKNDSKRKIRYIF